LFWFLFTKSANLFQDVTPWLLKADEDLLVANILIEHDFSAKASICFHWQQAAGKHLKALLITHDKGFPKTRQRRLVNDSLQINYS